MGRRSDVDGSRARQLGSVLAGGIRPPTSNPAGHLEANFIQTEISESAVTAITLLFLRQAAEGRKVKLTATDTLVPHCVEEVAGIIDWYGALAF